jgi:hydrogenase expression/formation protein HypC
MACVPDAEEGQFVLIHAGIAISRINEAEAQQLIADLARLADAAEWTEDSSSASGVRVADSGESP